MAEQDREWKPVVGYEGLYEVSDDGLVKSLPRPGRYNRNDAFILKQLLLPPRGYHYVNLYDAAGKKRLTYVHRAILLAFVGPAPAGMEALHADDDKDNNTLGNLRWGTRAENIQDCVKNNHHVNAGKTHCPRGHPYEGDNLIVYRGGRYCHACKLMHGERTRRKKGIPPRVPKAA
jgi:hypothetical protein